MNLVPGMGPSGAKICIVGEAPGAEEEWAHQPFVGPSGKLLNDMLSNAGIRRQDCYVTNVAKERPPNNDFEGRYYVKGVPTPELTHLWQSLQTEISSRAPNVVVPLGGEALRAVTGRSSITKWRGSILDSASGKVIPSLHPAYILRQWTDRAIVERDFRRVLEESAFPEVRRDTYEFITRPTLDQVLEFLSRKPERIAFDIETTGEQGSTTVFTRCLGIADSPFRAICIPFLHNPNTPLPGGNLLFPSGVAPLQRNSYWSPEDEYKILQALHSYMGRVDLQKTAHNFPFDSIILAREFGLDTSINFTFDTMVAQHTCYSELPKGLDFVASIYTRIPYYSDYDPSSDQQTWTYNCWDCVATYQSDCELREELVGLGMEEYYRNQVNPAVVAYARAESRGVLINIEERERETISSQSRLAELGTSITQSTGGQVQNPNSDTQLRKYFYETLHLTPILDHKTHRPTIGKAARATLANRHPEHSELLETIGEYSSLATLLSSFLLRPLGADQRIRTHYNVAGTVTGRLSSSEPLFDVGTNLQNIPRGEFRRLFVAPPGWLLLKADLSQAEFRIVVWKARITRFIERYLQDPHYDIHKWLASQIFQVQLSQVTKEMRQTAKNGVYGGQYGMHYTTASRTYKLPLATAKLVLDRFHALVPEIRTNFWSSIKAELLSSRTHRGPMGRMRIFLDRMSDGLERDARSHSAQHLVGDLSNRAFALADQTWDESEAFPLLQVHDEIVAQVRIEVAHLYARRLVSLMEYPLFFPGVPQPLIIPAEVSLGPDWFHQEKVCLNSPQPLISSQSVLNSSSQLVQQSS